MSEIVYNFAQNHDALTDINGGFSNVSKAQEEIGQIFIQLANFYTGAGAAAMQDAHAKVNQMLEDSVNDAYNTQKLAQEQQEVMQDLDNRNASAFP